MDIFNRPPTIAEDTLHYILYPSTSQSTRPEASALAALIRAHVDELCPPNSFLWHRDAFELRVVPDPDLELNEKKDSSNEGKWMMEGTMRVGDAVDDEWAVVWLLREISRKWDIVASVWDSDGEFLLIEAADVLPQWASHPSAVENRVWIHNTRMHLIPLTHVSSPSSSRHRTSKAKSKYGKTQDSDDDDGIGIDSDDNSFLSVQDAVDLVRDQSVRTEAPVEVEKAAFRRIERYPAALSEHLHTTYAWLPVDIARALSTEPQLVQKPVETFYTRDALQLRAAHKMARFPPQPSVLTPVKMTRMAYAQLRGQKFHPPKIFGRFTEREESAEWRRRDVGMKIACGFEMLWQEGKSKSVGVMTGGDDQAQNARKDALKRNPDYVKYMDTLRGNGYFRGELEGSSLWSELEDKAVMVFLDSRRDDDASRPSFASQVHSALVKAGPGVPEPASVSLELEDSEAWMEVDPNQLDKTIAEAMGQKAGPSNARAPNAMEDDGADDEEDKVASAQAARLKDLASKVEEFVGGKGTLEGATFADEGSDTDDGALSDFSEEHFSDSDDESDEEMTEDPAAAKVRRQAAMDKLIAPLGPEEYGKMPAAYYEHSQALKDASKAEQEQGEEDTQLDMNKDQKSNTNQEPPIQMRAPLLPRDKYDGVDSDDESDGEDDVHDERDRFAPLPSDEEMSDEDRPQVVGDVEIDMGAEEDEFLEFSRKALGISDSEWADIINERKSRGAFVPSASAIKQQGSASATSTVPPQHKPRQPQAGPRPNVNPNLDSFEAVMEAMETELAKQKQGPARTSTGPSSSQQTKKKSAVKTPTDLKEKGKAKVSFADAADEEDEDMDIEAAMDAELRAALGSGELDIGSDDEESMGAAAAGADYNLIKNFLESFKSQGGLSGPVGNLAGRLQGGWTLPRDDA